MINAAGRDIQEYIDGYGKVEPFEGAYKNAIFLSRTPVRFRRFVPGKSKMLSSIREAIEKCGIKNGMTISFHHHLRNGDYVMNMVLAEIKKMGIKNINIAASAIFPVHSPLVSYIADGTVTGISADYVSGPVADAISNGLLKEPLVMYTHGGRAWEIESGKLHIDTAFIAAPECDLFGNMNGVNGKSACGSLGYAAADAEYADNVVAITDNIVSYPACPIEISENYVNYVVEVDSIGNPAGIASGTTKITKDAVGLNIAKAAANVIEASGLLKDGFSFQTGAGGASLAVAYYLKDMMIKKKIKGSFISGGITALAVDMFRCGLFKSILDVQCFDLEAVKSLRDDSAHQSMTASMYANCMSKGCVADKLDVMILGATEIDTNFNVNVTTGSSGIIMGGSGGHSDTAAGAKLAIVATQLVKGRIPAVVDRVSTVTTPGETIDVLVTERGIAVNPRRHDLIEKLKKFNLPVVSIEKLKETAEDITGVPDKISYDDRIVGIIKYRDGTVIDVIRKVKQN